MIQLSSSPAEFIPVSQGTEKNNAPTTKDDGFRTALREQQDLSRETAASSGSDDAPAGGSAENPIRPEEGIREARAGEKASERRNDESLTSGKTSKSSETSESEKQAQAGKAGDQARASRTAKKGKENSSAASLLHLVKSDEKGAGKKADLKTLAAADRKKSSTISAQSLEAQTAAAAAEGASAMELAALKQGKAESLQAEGADTGLASSAPGTPESAEAGAAVQDLQTAEAVRSGEELLLQTAGARKSAALNDGKTAKSEEKKKSHDLKIAVEDRRSAKEQAPLLRRVDENSEGNKLTMEFAPSDDVTTAMPSVENADGSGKNFVLMSAEEQKGAALLDRQLQDKGTQELTKSIRFVLKDNKEGEIKLILKPEALGKVRINLNLHENNIVGKIIVENSNVRQVFLNNLADLTRSLEESGFDTASLDVSVGGGQTEGGDKHRNESPVYFASNAAEELDGQIPVVYEEGMNLGRIDLVV